MKNLIEQLYLWNCYWAKLVEGFIGVISFGFLKIPLNLYAECKYLDYVESQLKKKD